MKCIICQKDNIKPLGFSKHIKQHGYTNKSYYDKFIHDTSGKCLECNKSTRFVSITEGYKQFCSQKCAMQSSSVREKISIRTKGATEDIKRRNIEKYGVEWTTQLDSQKKKSKQTLLKHYDVDSPMKSELIREKHRKSTKNHLGVEYASQSKLIQEKTKKTCLDKYGVCSPVLIEDVHTKAIKSAWSEDSKNKRKTTCNKKYGVDYVCMTDYVQKKSHNKKAYEKKQNSTRQTLINKKLNSAEQLFCDLAKKNKLDYKYLYSSKEYPYLCDFYIQKK